MQLTFETLQECLSAFELIDSNAQGNDEIRTCVLFKNIRSFKKWNIAPLTCLNILTGPNSSGKSTLASIISNLRPSELKNFIQAAGENVKGSSYVGISIDWKEYRTRSDDPENYKTSVSWFHLMNEIKKLHNKQNAADTTDTSPNRITIIIESKGKEWDLDIYTFADQELIGFLSIGCDETTYYDEIYFKISKNFWSKLYSQEFSKKINSELANTPVYKKSRDKRKLNKEITGGQIIDSPSHFLDIKSYEDFDFNIGPDVKFGLNISDLYEVSYALICMHIVFFKPIRIFEKFAGETLPSLRPISSVSELQYKFEIGAKENDNVGNLKDISINTASSFRNLAFELAKERLKTHTYRSGSNDLKEVNNWLGNILSDSHKLSYRINVVDIKDKKHPWANLSKWKGSHIRNVYIDFFLSDSNKNELGLGDVGTGISQVLPVVSSIINSDHLVFLQPELHLHPKAQAILGDLFIYALQKNKSINEKHAGIPVRKITMETHSEHLILRLLRRIKENSDHISSQVFTNKNLSLIYVNPSKDGSVIHWIRIDKEGDFIDVWPNGFFEDRYEDLFFEKK